MGDQAVRYALQQTQFGPVAQLILIRLCRHVMDKDEVWIWRKKRTVIAKEVHASEATLKRHDRELEGRDEKGSTDGRDALRRYLRGETSGLVAALFRGDRRPLPTEFIILGPNRTATIAYLREHYPEIIEPLLAPSKKASTAQDERLETAQDERLNRSKRPPVPATTAQDERKTAQDERNIKERDSLFRILSSKDSLSTEQPELLKIWKTALTKIRGQTDKQTCFTWYDPARPVSLRGGVLTIAVPTAFYVDTLNALERKDQTIQRSMLAAGVVVHEVTFVARPKMAAAAARASPR
jgi:hypothetical protein